MNPETKEALQKSIEHWKRMRDNPSEDEVPGPETCALCQKFIGSGCKGCPVAEQVINTNCKHTPYAIGERAFWYYLNDDFAPAPKERSLQKWKEAAQDEIDFLESLLPNEKS